MATGRLTLHNQSANVNNLKRLRSQSLTSAALILTAELTTDKVFDFAGLMSFGGVLGVFKLVLAAALFAEIAAAQQLVFDLLQRQAAAGGVLGPRHVGAVQIAGVGRVGVKLLKRPNAHMRSPAAPPFPWLFALLYPAIAACSDAGDKFGLLRVNPPGG
jgi:hypothetical protein